MPHRSPIPPLLLVLHVTKLKRSGNSRTRLSYADDDRILGIGRLISESTDVAQRKGVYLLVRALQNAVSFDFRKSDINQYQGQRRENLVGIRLGNKSIELAEKIRWLCMHLDPCFNLKHHVTTWFTRTLLAAEPVGRIR